MFSSPAGVLILFAIVLAGAAMVPTWPEKYLGPAATAILAVAVLFLLAGGK